MAKAYLGSNEVTNCFLGSNAVSAAFLGTSPVCDLLPKFHMRITSSSLPVFDNIQVGGSFGGTIDIVDNLDGTYEATSFDAISWHTFAGTKDDITQIHYVKSTDYTSMQNMFNACINLTSITYDDWDTSGVISFHASFQACQALTDIPAIDTSAGEDFEYFCYSCRIITSMPAFDYSAGTSFYKTWTECEELLSMPAMNTSNGLNFNEAFNICKKLQCLTNIDTRAAAASNKTDMFLACNDLVEPDSTGQGDITDNNGANWTNPGTCPIAFYMKITSTSTPVFTDVTGGTITVINTGGYEYTAYSYDPISHHQFGGTPNNITQIHIVNSTDYTSMYAMFSGCSGMTSITFDNWDTSGVTDFHGTFHNCNALLEIPQMDTSNGTNFGYFCFQCRAITTTPVLDYSSGIMFEKSFVYCDELLSMPAMDTSSGTMFLLMFAGSGKLVCLTSLNTSNSGVTNRDAIFDNCILLQQPTGWHDEPTLYTLECLNLTDANGANWTNPGTCP